MNRILCILLFCIAGYPVAAQNIHNIDLKKKIALAEPAGFPQSPRPQLISSDAVDEHLKGKIQSLVEYTQNARKAQREDYKWEQFNEAGDLVRDVSFDFGYPESVTIWGFVDGMRVSRTATIEYAEGEKMLPKGVVQITGVPSDQYEAFSKGPRDSRYDMRHERDYDSKGRLVEKRDYLNNGVCWTRTTYEYVGEKMIERDFDSKGSQMSRTDHTLDASGNEVIEEMYGEGDKIDNRQVMAYDLDGNGNWVVQRTFEEKVVRKRNLRKLIWTSYRTITYYP